MTECNAKPLHFSSLGRKNIQADFDGGRLTSDTGTLLLREADQQMGLVHALADCIPDPRHPSLIQHSQEEMLAQRIYSIALGYEDLNDHDTLRRDPALQVATERIRREDEDQSLSSPSTLCRLENRISRESLSRIAKVFVEQFIASHEEPPEEIILDFDATDDPLHGHQEKRFFHGYYDCYCYLPLYVFCGDQLLVAYLRPSGIDVAKHSRAILKLLVRRFREVWPQVRIVFRGDSGFCRWRLMRWCEKNDVSYIIGLARNPILEGLAESWIREAELNYIVLGEKQRIFNTFRYAAKTWDKRRRVIVKAEHLEKGSNTRFIVTNLQGGSRDLYDNLYCQRGDMENRIKEQQLGLFADRTSCHSFLANQFRLFLSAAAYVLMESIRRVALKGTELARAQVHTIRIKLFKIASRVVKSVRRIVFHMATGYPYQKLFSKIVNTLRAQPSVNTSYR
jgi:hypothetical protein